ncbi:Lrp/AsnC family transcriptional regulator [Streptomyces sp. NPDC051993]|uniref:Lrp/AsnC family transcriptional regulator n=1 Tax=Streptomyces sp. NPDC051993 TaxID=3155286 RepID=UPI00341D33ED
MSAKVPPPRSSTCHGSQWRHDVLTATERADLRPPGPDSGPALDPSPGPYGIDTDPLEQSLIDALTPDARLPAATVAAHTGYPESTVRRRLAHMSAQHRLVTQVLIDPRAWDCPSRPNSSSAQPPDRLETAGQALADHHAVHGAFATSGPCDLHAVVCFPDLTALYEFLSRDLTGPSITHVESAIVSRTAKRRAPPAPNR